MAEPEINAFLTHMAIRQRIGASTRNQALSAILFLYRRVLNDELALAADVWDAEPVPLDSPLLGRHNVVHTPHNAGRTIDANRARADDAIARFRPR